MYSMIFQLFKYPIVSTILTTTGHLFAKTVIVTSIVPYSSFNRSCCCCTSKAVIITKRTDSSFAFNNRTLQAFFLFHEQPNKKITMFILVLSICKLRNYFYRCCWYSICNLYHATSEKFTELQRNIFKNVMNSIFKSILKGGQFWPLGHEALH